MPERKFTVDLTMSMKKGYHVTEAFVLAKASPPVSIFSRIHYSKEKDFTSVNDVAFSTIERGASPLEKAIFVMDRGYADNKMFLNLDSLERDYVIIAATKKWTMPIRNWGAGIRGVEYHVRGASTRIKQVRSPVSPSAAQAGALDMCSCFC